ncbi:copper resistance D family protein [Gottfriedia luciferensis]|uniref:copper resistance D family protein n=1 Tax=Gottfriedia luciferensis TaxID=178774 RepID=UPI000B44BDFC|nr:CopD family protein [Gottfriedia luciferensis]
MSYIIPLTEFISYVLYSILAGKFILDFVPTSKKPTLSISKKTVSWIIIGALFFSLFPVLRVILFFLDDINLKLAIYTVFIKTAIGNAWIYSALFAIMLGINIFSDGKKFFNFFWFLLMILSIGYAGHITSMNFWLGLIFQSSHLLMVSIWSGVLFHVAWLAKDTKNYTNFLRWFTPLAIICVIVIFSSGTVLMLEVVKLKDYTNAWLLPYGQMLLLKHISIIPVLFFAFFNSILIKKTADNTSNNIRKWLKAEYIMITFVFFFTAIMGTQSPPHHINLTLKNEGSSKWIEFLMGIDIVSPMRIAFTFTLEGTLLMSMSIIFLVLLVISFIKKTKIILPIGFGICFVIALYLGLMSNVSVQ